MLGDHTAALIVLGRVSNLMGAGIYPYVGQSVSLCNRLAQRARQVGFTNPPKLFWQFRPRCREDIGAQERRTRSMGESSKKLLYAASLSPILCRSLNSRSAATARASATSAEGNGILSFHRAVSLDQY